MKTFEDSKTIITGNGRLPNEVMTESELLVVPKQVRQEFIEVEPNVHLHVIDAGEGRAIVLLHGWPLSNEMYEYQYNDLVNNNFPINSTTSSSDRKGKIYKGLM